MCDATCFKNSSYQPPLILALLLLQLYQFLTPKPPQVGCTFLFVVSVIKRRRKNDGRSFMLVGAD